MPSPRGQHSPYAEDERMSDQPTPTWHQQSRQMEGDGMPDGSIMDWTKDDVAGWIASLGLGQYRHSFLEDNIDGYVLMHIGHEELRDLGISSVGHRLSILKNVYHIKIAHNIEFDSDDYIPVSADMDDSKTATQHDIQRLITIIRQRDQRIVESESQIQNLYDTMHKLRQELLPVWAMVKNKNQELPTPAGDGQNGDRRGTEDGVNGEQVHDPPPPNPAMLQPAPPSGQGLSRKFSMKRLILGTPKTSSPTYPSHHETPNSNTYNDSNQMNEPIPPMPSSNGISMNAPQIPPLNVNMHDSHPSPTSPATIQQPIYQSTPHASVGTFNGSKTGTSDRYRQPNSSRGPPPPPSTRTPNTPHYHDEPPIDRGQETPGSQSVEIFKSFRVSMDDPCHKVLPAALKRYNIQADWRQYALYIVHGDQERCLQLDERPLILFKQLAKEGRKPMFMLRRNAAGGGDAMSNGNQVPGGVL
ncbi:hypothetical protein EDC01DRAFT_10710 [Geopyxis carbonaria]|nr:hypothetical protein EDC01DRAFT_10710 [Geopyxis carbonaria]